jgi:hypothetical protein
MAIPQIGVEPLMPTISGKTHEFCVAAASVLDMPRVRVSLRLCHVWCVGGRAGLRLRTAFVRLSGGDLPFLLRRQARASQSLALADRSSGSCIGGAGAGGGDWIAGARFPTPVRLDSSTCTPGKSPTL